MSEILKNEKATINSFKPSQLHHKKIKSKFFIQTPKPKNTYAGIKYPRSVTFLIPDAHFLSTYHPPDFNTQQAA